MKISTKLIIAAAALFLLCGLAYWVHGSIYESGFNAGEGKVRKEIADANAEAERKNKTIVKLDQDLVVAKAEDKEKIVTIYRTIREQSDAQTAKEPVYRECRIPADGMRRIEQAASGNLRADTQNPASGATSQIASSKE